MNDKISEKKVWIIDLHNNFDWLEKVHRDKKLPEMKLGAKFNFENSPEFEGFWKLYGTEYEPCLVRFVLPNISTYEDCERFIYLKFDKMLRHLEISFSFLLEKSFNFKPIIGGPSTSRYLSFGQKNENDLPALIQEQLGYNTIDYTKLKGILSANFSAFEDYTELIQSGMNTNLKMEYRWLEFYKLIEMHFGVPSRELNGNHSEWSLFLENFKNELAPFLRPNQTLHGLMTDLRNGAAHFVITNKREKITETRKETLDKVYKTFPIILSMIVKIINDHPENKHLQLRTIFKTEKSVNLPNGSIPLPLKRPFY